MKFINQAEGYIEPDGVGGYDYVYQYKDYLGNVRLSYRDNTTLLTHDSFDTTTEDWQGNSALVSQENGMLRVDTDIAWGGAQKYFDVTVGDEISYEMFLDKASTGKLVVIMIEHNANFLKLNSTMVNADANGFVSGTYTVSEGSKLRLKIAKTSDPNIATYYYIDAIKVERKELLIKEENNYYPFGLKHRGYNAQATGTYYPYGFGGKEEQSELELNWLDFGVRNYDVALGRWMNLDTLAEQMRRHSPYNYAFDNPIYYVDPDGMMPFGNGGLNDRNNFDDDFSVWKPNYISSTYVDRTGRIIEHRDDGDPNIYLVLNPQNGLHQNWVIGTERPGITYNVGDHITLFDLNENYRNNAQALPNEFKLYIETADIDSKRTNMVFWAGEFIGNLNPKQALQLAKNLKRLILKGKMPKGVKRVDIPKLDPKGNPLHGQKPHLHLDDGRALNLDGTWKHGTGKIPKKILKWIKDNL